jgi:hypothetical protein
MNCQIINIVKDKGEVIGVLLQLDNGDTKYLTIKEYNKFVKT